MINDIRRVIRFINDTGIMAGLLVGFIAGVGGHLLTDSRPAYAEFAANFFLLLALIFPVVFLLRLALPPNTPQQPVIATLLTALIALVAAVIAFMIPVTMAAIVFNRGVTIETSGAWYNEVFTLILGWRLLIVLAVSAAAITYMAVRAHRVATSQPQ